MADSAGEFIPFRFRVALYDGEGGRLLCRGAFSEVSGLEATMAPKTLREGGRNWGEVQLAGPTSFEVADLWNWFDVSTRQSNHALRLSGTIDVYHPQDPDKPLLRWRITNALPTRFKGPDLSSTASQVAIEELQLVHEGLELERG